MSTTTPLPLAGKSALVTRAARSSGAEIALTLARRGAKVVVHYLSTLHVGFHTTTAYHILRRVGVNIGNASI
jgi:NAD(P)-dependent dehydrogenase (short-subunit alcohol dehydrogenase family)